MTTHYPKPFLPVLAAFLTSPLFSTASAAISPVVASTNPGCVVHLDGIPGGRRYAHAPLSTPSDASAATHSAISASANGFDAPSAHARPLTNAFYLVALFAQNARRHTYAARPWS